MTAIKLYAVNTDAAFIQNNKQMDTRVWLQQKLADESGLATEEIHFDREFEQLSLDSLSVITLAYELESYTGKELIDPSVFSEYNTINKLAAWLETQK